MNPGPLPQLRTIGTIHTPFRQAPGTPVQGGLAAHTEGEVIVEPQYQQGLADLDGFSHIMLIYAFHQLHDFKLKVKPYLDQSERGIFATRSPSRPNPLGITVVRLLEVDGCRLRIQGVDMLDGTPLLDIKPSVPAFDYHESVRCGWFEPHLERLKREGGVPVADDRFHREES
jgi:tRNA-Thr(GGU) m(6)t(6)A37 methyltransferase TsaA